MNKVSFRLTFAEALEIGVKNAPSIIGCVVLWLLTIWVPYINVGTTIAINMLPIELAKGASSRRSASSTRSIANTWAIFSSRPA